MPRTTVKALESRVDELAAQIASLEAKLAEALARPAGGSAPKAAEPHPAGKDHPRFLRRGREPGYEDRWFAVLPGEAGLEKGAIVYREMVCRGNPPRISLCKLEVVGPTKDGSAAIAMTVPLRLSASA